LRKAGTTPSLVDIVRRGLEHEQVREGSASREQIAYAVLGKVCSGFYNYEPTEPECPPSEHEVRAYEADVAHEEDINSPIPEEWYNPMGFVNARDLMCPFARAGASWCEVLRTLLCMRRDQSYCLSQLCGCARPWYAGE